MQKQLLFVLFISIISPLVSQAQEQTNAENTIANFAVAKRHELSLDVISAIAIPAFNPRYEYIVGRFSGVGADLFIAFDGDDLSFSDYEKLSLTPYYRQYFFSKEDYGAKGFYAEGFVKFFSYEEEEYLTGNNSTTTENYFDTSIGVGIGWKWISQNGFLVDLGFGVGRNLGLSNDAYFNSVQLRGGLNFGWRF